MEEHESGSHGSLPKQTRLECHDSCHSNTRELEWSRDRWTAVSALDVDHPPTRWKDVQTIIHKPIQDRRISSRSPRQPATDTRWQLTGMTYPG